MMILMMNCFTFHNVSIKTMYNNNPQYNQQTLHSTMFLLKLEQDNGSELVKELYIPQCFY